MFKRSSDKEIPCTSEIWYHNAISCNSKITEILNSAIRGYLKMITGFILYVVSVCLLAKLWDNEFSWNHDRTYLLQVMVGIFFCGSGSQSGALCKTGYLSETYLKLKPSEVSFAHSLFHIDSIVFKCCTLHSGDTDVICANYQKNCKTERDVILTRFSEFWVWDEFRTDICLHWTAPLATDFFSYTVPRWKFNISRVMRFWGLPNVHLCLIGAVEQLSLPSPF